MNIEQLTGDAKRQLNRAILHDLVSGGDLVNLEAIDADRLFNRTAEFFKGYREYTELVDLLKSLKKTPGAADAQAYKNYIQCSHPINIPKYIYPCTELDEGSRGWKLLEFLKDNPYAPKKAVDEWYGVDAKDALQSLYYARLIEKYRSPSTGQAVYYRLTDAGLDMIGGEL